MDNQLVLLHIDEMSFLLLDPPRESNETNNLLYFLAILFLLKNLLSLLICDKLE